MKFHFELFTKRAVGVIVGSFLLVVTFQNCGKAGFDSALDDSLTSSSVDPNLEGQFGSRDALKVQSIPFAYDVVPDQIAYSSCFGSGLQSLPGHFTFRIGAYSTGGVKIRQNFFDYLKANFQPISPATELSTNQIKTYLAYSPENTLAAPQFAIRTRGLPQLVRTSSAKATVGLDFINVLMSLTDDRMMDPLVNNRTSNTMFFPMASQPTQRNLEASISYNTTQALSESVRNDFRTSAMLAMTYVPSTPALAYSARIPASATTTNTDGTTTTDNSKAYGRGYYMQFVSDLAPYTQTLYAQTTIASNNPTNILFSIQEINLENSTTSGTWSCPFERRYVIVPLADAPISCPQEKGTSMSDSTYRRELEIVRRQLKAEDWDVNIALRCVVPKQGSCYVTDYQGTTALGIEYNQANECYQGANYSYTNPASPPLKRCAQYVTICNRN